ncbi:MAG: sensor histidine kinase [Butyrivibrio sp.]|nr:sensor histidine kinase [Butyrivibrio sp.]
MGNMADSFGVMLLVYTVRGIFGFIDYWIIFEKFFDFPKEKWKNTNWLWIVFFAVINLAYRPVMNYRPKYICLIIFGLYLIRIVPFLWAKYGLNPSYLLIVLFYGNLVDCLGQNIFFLFLGKMNIEIYPSFKVDISVLITEVVVFAFLMVLLLLKRVLFLKICFTKLTVVEYILLFLFNMFYGLLEATIFKFETVNGTMRALSIITFSLLIILILHVIMIREQNTSMNTMIGNLKEPMKQITASYIEMNEKNTELRRFRHDTKNLLLALSSLISEGKYEQANSYIAKMQETMETTKIKEFDTGNFIADALLESKAKAARASDIGMTVEGCIPANRVEDVNLVILISNLLDNAIEAAKQVDGERKIEIQSILRKNIWILSVKNPCVKNVMIRENKIETTKENKEVHGFGISNIERVTRKYDGELQLSCENQVFTARATIMLTA